MRAVVVMLVLAFAAPAHAAQLGGPDPQDVDPVAVAYAPDGTLLVGDEDRRIARLDATGAVQASISLQAAPQEIAVGSSGVVAALVDGELVVPTRSGPPVALDRTTRGLAVTADGMVLVGDPEHRAVRRFSPDELVELAPLRLGRSPEDIAVLSDGSLAVTLATTDFDAPGAVVILDGEGRELRRLALSRESSTIAAAPAGALVVEDGYGRLTRIAPDGVRTRITEFVSPSDLSVAPDGGLAAIEVENAQYGGQSVQLIGLDPLGRTRALRPPCATPALGVLEDPYAVGATPGGGGEVVALDAGVDLNRFDAASGAPLKRRSVGYYVEQVAPLRGGGYLISDDDPKSSRSILLLDARGYRRRKLASVAELPELAATLDGGFVTLSVSITGSQRSVVQRYGPTGRRVARFGVRASSQLVALPHGLTATISGSRVTIHEPNGPTRRTLRLSGLHAIDAATDGHGRLLVLQGTGVRRYALTDGRRLADAHGDDSLRGPQSLAVSGDRVYVADAGNDRISVLRTASPNVTPPQAFGQTGSDGSVASRPRRTAAGVRCGGAGACLPTGDGPLERSDPRRRQQLRSALHRPAPRSDSGRAHLDRGFEVGSRDRHPRRA